MLWLLQELWRRPQPLFHHGEVWGRGPSPLGCCGRMPGVLWPLQPPSHSPCGWSGPHLPRMGQECPSHCPSSCGSDLQSSSPQVPLCLLNFSTCHLSVTCGDDVPEAPPFCCALLPGVLAAHVRLRSGFAPSGKCLTLYLAQLSGQLGRCIPSPPPRGSAM